MARLFPPYALSPEQFGNQTERAGIVRERETLRLLAATLSDKYMVFHSTHLAWIENGRLRKREADFLVVNQAGDVLMIEQKAGPLDETPAGLMKIYDGYTKNVVTQCNDITDALRARYLAAYGQPLTVSFLLFCPDYRVRGPLPAGLARTQILDAQDRQRLVPTIHRQLPEGQPDPARFAQVRAMLSQDLTFALDPQAQALEGVRVLTALTDGLLGVLTGLEMTPYRLRIAGAAGCGKTQMVTAFAERWHAAGRRVLVACFNRSLADQLRARLPAEIEVETVHGVARRLLESAGMPVDVAAQASERDFWGWLLKTATDAALLHVPPDWCFDALVVDEGQDIDRDGFDLLQLLLPKQADTVWLDDENQRLFSPKSFTAPDFVTYRCQDNFRSPQRIVRFLEALLPIPIIGRNPLPGDRVAVQEANNTALTAELGSCIKRLLTDGYTPDQIVVLTGRGQQMSGVLREASLGGCRTRRFNGFSENFTARYTDGDLSVETLWRFKGQQSPVVLICELDGELAKTETVRQLYCAATRATTHLEFFVPRRSRLLAPLQRAASQANAAPLS
jgi:hypothetical protein